MGRVRRWYLSITDALRLLPNLETMTGRDKRRANVRDLRDSPRALFKSRVERRGYKKLMR
jgi:hypothetical protein